MSVNKVILMGTLGKDPELKFTPGGSAVCSFSIATKETWYDEKNEKHEKTEWHKIVVWGKKAESCNQYLAKGSQVYIEGKLQTRSWDDKDGTKRYTTEISAKDVQFINRKKESGGEAKPKEEALPFDESGFASDDIPY
jgi:single-strand DNA-binding protein